MRGMTIGSAALEGGAFRALLRFEPRLPKT
jgi:hypothetical protein